MRIAPGSRYDGLAIATHREADGRTVSYLRRRFVPQADGLPLLAEVVVTRGDRLDLVAARTLGDPELYWRICDANEAMNPEDVMAEIGRMLRIPQPTL
jgi:hypothetical protein